MKRLLTAILTITIVSANAQSWQFMRHEFGLGIGATNFLGELGGANQEGTDYLRDFEFSMTRPTVQLDYRFTFNPNLHVKLNLIWGQISGDDALTTETFRHNRNLNFKSNIWEAAIHFEYFPWGEKLGHIYRIKGAKGKKYSYFSPYVFAGIGGFKFNPKGELNGTWHELKPMGTEGQGLPDGAEEYSLYQICIPFGFGVKYAITKQWNIGFELSRRLTFTDYIDDVSTDYYDNTAIANANGQIAADLADPSLGEIPTWTDGSYVYDPTRAGMQRGDPTDNDTYMFAVLSINYKLLYGKFNLPKF